ncbi:MAG: hypothetical protein IKU07_09105 [Oscillospiraceae bacterium]|nr:hypothetical protein [Oscillospiraceae bacterium]
MEPWEEELAWQRQGEQLRQRRPRCHSCERPITTERYLELSAFGLDARVCEDCARGCFRETVYEEDYGV